MPDPNSSARAQRHLKRRKVSIVGDWHLFVQYCDWKISVAGGSLDSRSIGGTSSDECLADLDGQRLVSIASGPLPNSWKFEFDLGGVLEVQSSAAYEPADDMWSLHGWNGDISAMQNDGKILFEKATARSDTT
jgi:hypothetical protein